MDDLFCFAQIVLIGPYCFFKAKYRMDSQHPPHLLSATNVAVPPVQSIYLYFNINLLLSGKSQSVPKHPLHYWNLTWYGTKCASYIKLWKVSRLNLPGFNSTKCLF